MCFIAYCLYLRRVPLFPVLHHRPSSLSPHPLSPSQKPPKAAEGYPDDASVLFKFTSVADFITGDDQFHLLSSSHSLHFDKPSEVFAKHPLTTSEIRELCGDIKVLGPR